MQHRVLSSVALESIFNGIGVSIRITTYCGSDNAWIIVEYYAHMQKTAFEAPIISVLL